MSTYDSLSPDEQGTLTKLSCLVGPEDVGELLAQGRKAVIERLETFMKYEASLRPVSRNIGTTPMSSATSLGPDDIQGTKPLTLHVKPFEGKKVKTF